MSKDTIYRQDAIEALDDVENWVNIDNEDYILLAEAVDSIRALSSAESDTEEWIGGELGHTSKCGHEGCSSDIWDRCKNFYCPNCGRKVIWR